MRTLTGPISNQAVDVAIVKYMAAVQQPVTTRALTNHLSLNFRIQTYKACNATTAALLRLRARRIVTLTGRTKAARYSLSELAVVRND